MAAYVKLTNFAVKDGLLSGNPLKVVTGAELDDEFNAIASSSQLNYDNLNNAVDAFFVKWTHSSTITMADPGSGQIRLNNVTPASVTAIAIDDLNADGADVSSYVVTWDDATSSNKGTLTLKQGNTFAIYTITGLTDNSGWTQLAVTYISGSGTFTSGNSTYVSFYRTGDASSEVLTVAGIAADVTTVAGISASVSTVAGIAPAVTTVSSISSSVSNVSSIAADVIAVSTNSANVTAVATDITNINTVAADLANVDTVATNIGAVNSVAAIDTDVATVAGIAADVSTVATLSTDIPVVSANSANITSVAAIDSDVTAVAGISSDISAVAAQFIGWNFDTTTSMADPGSGKMRFNNATLASVTAIALDDLNSAAADVSAYVLTWDDATSTNKGTLTIRQGTANYAIFNVTGLTDNAGWTEIAVAHVSSSGTFLNNTLTFVDFDRTGDAGTGDVSSNTSSSVDNEIALFSGTGGKTIKRATTTGILKASSGVLSAATAGTDYGYVNIPQSGSAKTTSYSLATTDIGEFIEVGSGGSITIPDATFAAGDVVSIFNNTSAGITITCSITTAYIAGTDSDKATVTLATRGLATILFLSGTVCVITGNVS